MRLHLCRRTLPMLLGVAAVAVAAAPAAESASTKECLGRRPNVVGTKGNDVIRIRTDEDGSGGALNGRPLDAIYESITVFADKGNDKIFVESTGPVGVRICAGDGNDRIEGEDIVRLHGGKGYDTAVVHLICDMTPDIFATEEVRPSTHPVGDSANCFEGGSKLP